MLSHETSDFSRTKSHSTVNPIRPCRETSCDVDLKSHCSTAPPVKMLLFLHPKQVSKNTPNDIKCRFCVRMCAELRVCVCVSHLHIIYVNMVYFERWKVRETHGRNLLVIESQFLSPAACNHYDSRWCHLVIPLPIVISTP